MSDSSQERRDAAQRAVTALINSAHDGRGGALVVRGSLGDDLDQILTDQVLTDDSSTTHDRVVRIVPAPMPDQPGSSAAQDLGTIVRSLLAARSSELSVADTDELQTLLRDDSPAPDRFTLAVTLHRILTALSADAPLTLLIEHAEQLDDRSAAALVFVARRIADDPIAIVLGRSDTGTPSPLDDLAGIERSRPVPPGTGPNTTTPGADHPDDSVQDLLQAADAALDAALLDAATLAVDRLAFTVTDGSDRARRHLAEGRLAILRGDEAVAVTALEEAIHLAEDLSTPVATRTATQARLELLQLYLRAGRTHLAAALGDQLSNIGGPHAELAVTAAHAARGEQTAVRTITEQAEQVIAHGSIDDAGFVAGTAGLALVWSEHYEPAARLLDRLARATRHAGALGPLPTVLAVQSLCDLRRSRYPSAAARADEAVRFADATGRPGLAMFPVAVLAVAEAIRGDETGCRLASSRLVDHAARAGRAAGSAATEIPARAAMGLLHLGLDRPEQAVAQLGPLMTAATTPTPWLVMWQMDLAEALVRTGRSADAATLIDRFVEGLGRTRNDRARAAADRTLALIVAPDDPDRAAQLLDDTEQRYREVGLAFGLARTLHARGRLRREWGRIAEAVMDLEEAGTLFHSMGAAGWSAQVDNELAAVARGSSAATPSNPASLADLLTPQELQVAALIAAGLSNKEAGEQLFVSARTIESHLGRIYRKLDLRSRNQLTARADEWGLRDVS